MKTTMKKTAAYLLAMLLIFQMLPALADGTESNIVHPITQYRDKLDITAVTKTLTVGMQITLTVNENYERVVWSSQNENIATVDQNGVVTGVSEGKVKITAAEDGYSDSVTLLVVAAGASSGQETASDGNRTPSEEMVIFINGRKQRLAYNGTEYVNEYAATSNRADFSAEKLHLTEEGETHLAHATNGGVAYDNLTEEDFYYDSDETVTIVITNGWLQVRPATLNIYVNNATKNEGDPDPAFSADLDGLKGNDTAESIGIQYSVTEDNRIVPNVVSDDIIGNYRVGTVMAGILTIQEIIESPLYNIAQVVNTNNYYRLRKTTIKTYKSIDEYVADITKDGNAHVLSESEYTAEDYDFANEIVTYNDKKYAHISRADDGLKVDGYYTIVPKAGEELTAVKKKIGASAGWLITDGQYNDPNATNSFHRNYIISFVDVAQFTTQDLYSMLSVNGSGNYHRLKKSTFSASANMADLKAGTALQPSEYTMTPYDFTNVVIMIDGVDYHYYEEAPEDEYISYYTVEFERVIKENRFNNDAKWYTKDEGFLDNSRSDYENLPNNTAAFHANYKATTHKGKERVKSIKLTSDFAKTKGYVGDKITLTAHLSGFEGLTEGVDYRLEWQYKTSNAGEWTAVRNANGTSYTFTLNQTTTRYTWRVVAIDLK